MLYLIVFSKDERSGKVIHFSLVVIQLEYTCRKSILSCYPLTHRKQVSVFNLIFQVTLK